MATPQGPTETVLIDRKDREVDIIDDTTTPPSLVGIINSKTDPISKDVTFVFRSPLTGQTSAIIPSWAVDALTSILGETLPA